MNKVTLLVTGIEQLKRNLALTNVQIRANTKAHVKRSTETVLAAALQRVPRASGELASTGRAEFSDDGLVGFVKFGYGKLPRRSSSKAEHRVARLRRKRRKTGKGAYGPIIEYGDKRRNRAPQPYLKPAFNQEKAAIIAGFDRALGAAVPSALKP